MLESDSDKSLHSSRDMVFRILLNPVVIFFPLFGRVDGLVRQLLDSVLAVSSLGGL